MLNLTKSSVKYFGRWKDRTDVPGGLSLSAGPLRILGVHFQAAQCATANWTRRLEAVGRKLSLWKARTLTFVGKVLVLKMEVLPVLTFLAYVYPMPASMRRPLMRLVFRFLWGGRYEVVARRRMLATAARGGGTRTTSRSHQTLRLYLFFLAHGPAWSCSLL